MSEKSPYSVQCPACEAEAGRRCTTVVGHRSEAHPERWEEIGIDIPDCSDRERAWVEMLSIRDAERSAVR